MNGCLGKDPPDGISQSFVREDELTKYERVRILSFLAAHPERAAKPTTLRIVRRSPGGTARELLLCVNAPSRGGSEDGCTQQPEILYLSSRDIPEE